METKTIITILSIFGLAMGLVIVGSFLTAAPDFEVRRLLFAAAVLAVLAFLLVLGIAAHMTLPAGQTTPSEAGRAVFDSLIKVIPPIITLVLGFYFGQTSTAPSGRDQSMNQSRTKGDDGKSAAGKTGETTVGALDKAAKSPEAQASGSPSIPTSSSSVGATSETRPKTPEGQPKQPVGSPTK